MGEWNKAELAAHVRTVMPPRVREDADVITKLRELRTPESTHRVCRWAFDKNRNRMGWVPGPLVAQVTMEAYMRAAKAGTVPQLRPNRASNQRAYRAMTTHAERIARRLSKAKAPQ